MERVDWDPRLANHLMSLCDVGHTDEGAKCGVNPVEWYCVEGVRSPVVCHGGPCKNPSGSR